jgi:hypothetical protein
VTKYVGTEHVIFEIEFVFPKFDEEFIKEINEYFNPDKYVSEYISYVTYDKTEKFIS